MQRELLALLGKLAALPAGFSPRPFLDNEEALVRREAVRLLLRNPADRDETIMGALSDADDRVVFAVDSSLRLSPRVLADRFDHFVAARRHPPRPPPTPVL